MKNHQNWGRTSFSEICNIHSIISAKLIPTISKILCQTENLMTSIQDKIYIKGLPFHSNQVRLQIFYNFNI